MNSAVVVKPEASEAIVPEAAPPPAAEAAVARADRAGKERKAAREEEPTTPPPAGAAIPIRDDRSFWPVIASTVVGVLVAFAIGRSGWFEPGDNIGYYTGLVGGVFMLLLLLYPARKYLRALRTWGPVKHWFSVHMVLGITGPILVLAHSTFHMRSTNASVALICMLIVAGSGIVGRYLYTKVHRGLYGEKLSLGDLQAKVGTNEAEMRSKLRFVPNVERRLMDFETYALADPKGFGSGWWRFLTIGLRRGRVYHACVSELRSVLRQTAKARQWDRDKYRRRLRAAAALVQEFLVTSQRVAQFSAFDKLLQLWHVAHVPLVYLLVISGIAHVVAVHMY